MLEESAAKKDALLQKKVKTIGNYVHDSVPISNNEVHALPCAWVGFLTGGSTGQEYSHTEMGSRGSQSREEGLSFTS